MDKGKSKREIIVPILCILLSIGLWFYVTNIENPIKSIEMTKVPVEIVNIQSLNSSNLALAPQQQFYVNLKIEGMGSQIYQLDKKDFKLKVDLNEYALKKGENRIPVTVASSPTAVNIKNDNSLSVNIVLEELSKKTVEIKSDINVKVKQGFFYSNPELKNKDVTISGPKSLVDSVSSVIAFGEESDVTQDIVGQYPLKAVDSDNKEVQGVSLSIDKVQVSIKINKGKSVPLKIITMGELPNGMKIKSMEPTRKTVEITGKSEILDKIGEVQSTQLDLSKITGNTKVSLKVVLPEGVSISQGGETVEVNVSVIKGITKEFDVPVTTNGLKEGLGISLKNNTVKVVVFGNEEIVNKVTVNNIKAVLNASSYVEPGDFEATPDVKLTDVNESVTINSIGKVQVTVVKKEGEKPSEKPAQ